MVKKLLQYQDVGVILGISRQAVYQRYIRGLMPPPDAFVGDSPAWYSKTIDEYAKTYRRYSNRDYFRGGTE
jgi:predicted DNA-binding transcriptional regulator AlpA